MVDPFAIVRPYLQPITHSLPPAIQEPLTALLTPKCYQILIDDINPLASPSCIKLAVSKAIGIGIIAASSVVKIPQLLKLLNARSAQGVSFLSYLLETTAYAINLAYNFRKGNPFSTYGETALILIQNVAIAVMVLTFSSKSSTRGVPWPAIFVAGVAAAAYALFSPDVVSSNTLQLLQMATLPLNLASKVPQIAEVQRAKSTGQLSAFAVFNYLAGSLARVFTTLAEVDDVLILAGFIGGAALNAVLAGQMVMFWNNSGAPKEVTKERKKA
ncbi:hypothetical protein BDZ91DRAFT_673457 [Kalaharituber pfeilii]|nr:hypothetical protein BDZ91DRAFT_673457 [Kalaharituber pfeilii]